MLRNMVGFPWSGYLVKLAMSIHGPVPGELAICAKKFFFEREQLKQEKSSNVQRFFLLCFQARVSSVFGSVVQRIHTPLADKSKQHVHFDRNFTSFIPLSSGRYTRFTYLKLLIPTVLPCDLRLLFAAFTHSYCVV